MENNTLYYLFNRTVALIFSYLFHNLYSQKIRLRAPIASMDAMEDMDLLSGSNTHLSKLSSECNIMAGAVPTKTTFPGLKYRHIGKTGLKVSNIALGNYSNSSE